ncbi:toxin-antitoxin system TumE family protein [Oryzomonas rubra]|uniref:Uncharacterized protein n=1 Tax=Oryzomonas rubra TaxID=2509454 RepID=A0A5A9XB27_9BACT|nr:DUF6516 family protein [Oryzomonas rubra]KAA0889803.1 hypothetical protein ET418_13600 [Oryzomonas rubra]
MSKKPDSYIEERDTGLDTLLSLHGTTFEFGDDGYWVKFEAWLVAPNKHRPHGINYSLTLHDRYNKRVIGFDNAHAPQRKPKGYIGRKVEWDHEHKTETVQEYDFKTPAQLLVDFWNVVEKVTSK